VLQTHSDGLDVLRSDECRAQIAAGVRLLDLANRIVVFGIGPSAALATYVSVLLARWGDAVGRSTSPARCLPINCWI
jgi:DNA-binding MurR/RpiR family transcriptional regulator